MKIKIVFAALFMAIVFTTVYLYRELHVQKQKVKEVSQALTLSNQETEYFKSVNGTTIAQVKSIQGSVSVISIALGEQKDLIEKKFGSLNKLQEYVSAGIVSSGHIYTTIRDSTVFDTIKAKTFNLNDGYLSMRCLQIEDSLSCPYTYKDTLELAIKLNRNWRRFQFMKRRELRKKGFDKWSPVTQVLFSNPNSKAVNVKSYIIK